VNQQLSAFFTSAWDQKGLLEYAPEWYNALNDSTDEDIRQRVSEVAFSEATNQQAKEDDEDLANLKEQVKLANEPYAQATKVHKAQIRYAKSLLEARGKPA
jgi:hypothetical protein